MWSEDIKAGLCGERIGAGEKDRERLERKMEREGNLKKEKLSDVPRGTWFCRWWPPAQNPGVSNPGCWLFFPLKDFSVLNWLLPSSPRSTSKRRRLTDHLEFPSAQISLLFINSENGTCSQSKTFQMSLKSLKCAMSEFFKAAFWLNGSLGSGSLYIHRSHWHLPPGSLF